MKIVRHVNYKADYQFAPPIESALINLDDVQAITEEDSRNHRVSGPLVKIAFRNGKTMICEGRVEDFAS